MPEPVVTQPRTAPAVPSGGGAATDAERSTVSSPTSVVWPTATDIAPRLAESFQRFASVLQNAGASFTIVAPQLEPFSPYARYQSTLTRIPSETELRDLAATPISMRADFNGRELCPFFIETTGSPGADRNIKLYDLLSPEPLIKEFNVAASADQDRRNEITQEINELVLERAQAANQRIQSTAQSRAPASDYGIRRDNEQILSAAQIQSLDKIFERYDYITIRANGPNGEIPMAVLDRRNFPPGAEAPLVVNGTVTEIGFIGTGFRSRGQPLQPGTEDRSGNLYRPHDMVDSVYAHIRTDLSGRSDGGQRTIALDAPSFGIPECNGIIVDTNPEKISTNGPLPVFGIAGSERDRSQIASALNRIQHGAIAACEYFGVEGAVESVFLVENNVKNASFAKNNPGAVTIYDGIFRMPLGDFAHIGVHEAAHLIDHKFGLSGSEVKKAWDSGLQQPSSEWIVDETRFFGRGGGHSFENPAELFASTITSLMHPNWNDRVADLQPSDQRFYLECLKAVRGDLESTAGIPPEAPIREDLDSKIYFLERLTPSVAQEPASSLLKGLDQGFKDLKLPPVPEAQR